MSETNIPNPSNAANLADLAELKRIEDENAKLRAEQEAKISAARPGKSLKDSSKFFKDMDEKEFDEYVEKLRKERENVPDDIESTYFDIPEHLKDPRFHYHIFNDYQGRINFALSRKYEFVKDPAIARSKNLPEGENIKFPNGTGVSYLMRIPKVLWDEDQKKVENKNKEMNDLIEGRDPTLDHRIKSSKKIDMEDVSDFE